MPGTMRLPKMPITSSHACKSLLECGFDADWIACTQGGVGQDGMPLCHRILEVSPEHFVRAGLMGCAEVKEFRMPPPPVPLFKIAA